MEWNLRVPTLSINPASATLDDVARLASELMELRHAVQTALAPLLAAHSALLAAAGTLPSPFAKRAGELHTAIATLRAIIEDDWVWMTS